MENSLRFAAVDIGSNAVRLFFGYVIETSFGPSFNKASLIRLPIRLGEDSFHKKQIPDSKVEELIEALLGFQHLVKAFKVISFRVCATSAMRDAVNGPAVVAKIKEKTGIEIELIDGEAEAALIFENHVADKLAVEDAFIYMDVGGGSTEYTLYKKGEKLNSRSFNIGTIRLKDNLVQEDVWSSMFQWLAEIKKEFAPKQIIGSGGNINTLFKLSQLREMEPLSKRRLKRLFKMLKNLSYDEKISKLKLRPDRADVIVPATELFLVALKHSGCREVLVPKVGLVDGMVHQLYDQHKANEASV
tara:strand:- start:977 stop:1882 length:906 start_codon:yes stop_codon:yes gene_type:complete